MARYLTAAEMKWQDVEIPMTWADGVEPHDMIAESCMLSTGEGGIYTAMFRMPKGYSFDMHLHATCVQSVVLQGQLQLETKQDGPRVFNAGECYIIEPDEPHVETALEDSVVLITVPRGPT